MCKLNVCKNVVQSPKAGPYLLLFFIIKNIHIYMYKAGGPKELKFKQNMS